MFYKIVNDNIITMVGKWSVNPENGVEITEEEKTQLESVIAAKPADTLESVYRLSAETEQYEPFTRTHEEIVDWYVRAVSSGEMTLEEVPEEYRSEVETKLPTPTEPTYTLDEAATILAQEVSA